MTVTHFTIEYDSINSKNTFTNGDTITGRVILEVSKETTISSLVFIGKGEARVRWSEQYGQYQHHVYWQNEKYYEVKHYLVRASRQDGKVYIFFQSVRIILGCHSGSTDNCLFPQALKSLRKDGMCSLFPFRFLTGAHFLSSVCFHIHALGVFFNSFAAVVLDRKLPSTFTSCIGKIIHKLKAELKQSMKLSKKAKVHFTFVSKPDMDIPGLMVKKNKINK